MKKLILAAAVAVLLPALDFVSSGGGDALAMQCTNPGYRGNVWCCAVNSDQCKQRAGQASGANATPVSGKAPKKQKRN